MASERQSAARRWRSGCARRTLGETVKRPKASEDAVLLLLFTFLLCRHEMLQFAATSIVPSVLASGMFAAPRGHRCLLSPLVSIFGLCMKPRESIVAFEMPEESRGFPHLFEIRLASSSGNDTAGKLHDPRETEVLGISSHENVSVAFSCLGVLSDEDGSLLALWTTTPIIKTAFNNPVKVANKINMARN